MVLVVAWIYPFIWLLSASVKPNAEIFSQGLALLPEDWAFENFTRAWTAANFGTYFKNTVIVSSTATVLGVSVAALAGYAIARSHVPFRRSIVIILIATQFVPPGFTIIPLFDMAQTLHLTSSLLGLVLAESGAQLVLFILLFSSSFAAVPRDLEEAAIVDGASFPRIFRSVMVPQAKPTIAATGILLFMGSWNSFFIPLVFTLGRPDLRTVSVGMTVFVGEYSTDWGAMAAAATVSVLPLILVFVAFQRWFVEGLTGALKA